MVSALDFGPLGYKTFFMLISAEHEISSANKYENVNYSWLFFIFLSREIFMLSYVRPERICSYK